MKAIQFFIFLICFVLSLPFQAAGQSDIPARDTPNFQRVQNKSAKSLSRSLDHHLLITVDTVMTHQKKARDIVLIDIRDAGGFSQVHIQGSINIPLYLLKTKEFLKQKFVVLLSEGYAYLKMAEEVEKLKKAGFANIFILDGGLYGWRQSGGVVEGDVFAINKLNRMIPSQFFQERHYVHWIIIDVSSESIDGRGELFPDTIRIPYRQKNERFLEMFNKAIAFHAKSPQKYVLIYNRDGDQYEEIIHLLVKTSVPVFFLEGGEKGYRTFYQRQVRMWNPGRLRTGGAKACQTCP